MATRAALPCFTVAQLAERWACHRSHVYRMIDRGEITPFYVGTLARIHASEVERIECPKPLSASSASAPDGPLSGATATAHGGVTASTRPIGLGQRRKPAGDGKPATVLPGRWGGQ
ncbi:MAG: excisionase family DNA-binding protein [Alphaproteobacteria bacterium]|nr:excisionase family DNA-binding protein [Alphaproteobacteria bacterium]